MERMIGWLEAYDWNNPLIFLYIAIGYFLFTGHWRVAAPAMIAIALASLLPDMIIFNIVTRREVLTIPVLLYFMGIVLSGITALHIFIRYMLT